MFSVCMRIRPSEKNDSTELTFYIAFCLLFHHARKLYQFDDHMRLHCKLPWQLQQKYDFNRPQKISKNANAS
jgi:hypothetical protein